MTDKKLTLSASDKKIAGVCGGIAEYFELDASLIRTVWLLSAILAGSGLLAYIICWIVIPKERT